MSHMDALVDVGAVKTVAGETFVTITLVAIKVTGLAHS